MTIHCMDCNQTATTMHTDGNCYCDTCAKARDELYAYLKQQQAISERDAAMHTYRVTYEPLDHSYPKQDVGEEFLDYADAQRARAEIQHRTEASGEQLIVGIERSDGSDPFARINRTLRTTLVATVAALALIAPTSAQDAIPAPPCNALTFRVYEDLSAAAYCSDGTRWGFDPATDSWYQSTLRIFVGYDAKGERHIVRYSAPVQ